MGIDRGVNCMSKVFDENLSCSADMQSSLRDRIAAAISGVDDWRGVTDPAILADAVIDVLADVAEDCRCQLRYLSEWETDGGR